MSVVIAIERFLTPVGTGNVDWTTTDLLGLTPKAVIIIASNAEVNGTKIVDIAWGVGIATGAANELCVSGSSEDGQTTTDTKRAIDTARILDIDRADSFHGDVEATFVQFITDGVRLNFSDVAQFGRKLYQVIFFAGDDIEVHAGSAALGLVDTTFNVTDPGFQADLVFAAAVGGNSDSSNMHLQYGWAAPGVSDAGINVSDRNGIPISQVDATVRNDGIISSKDLFTSNHFIATSSVNANGFDLNVTNDDASTTIIYLAVKFTGISFKVGTFDSPTASGDDVVTGVGFKPQFVFLGLSSNDTLNVGESAGSDHGGFGMGLITESKEFCASWATEDDQDFSDTQSLSVDDAVGLCDGSGATIHAGTFVSMNNDGFTINYSTFDATVRKWFYMAIEGEEEGFAVIRRRLEDY